MPPLPRQRGRGVRRYENLDNVFPVVYLQYVCLLLFSQLRSALSGGSVRHLIEALLLAIVLSPRAAHAAEGGGLINLDASLLVQAVNFLLLLVLLYKLAYRPLLAKMEERTAAIKQQLEEAERAREEGRRSLAEHEARLQTARAEAGAIRERALREAQAEEQKLIADAKEEAARLLESARAEIRQDVRRARAELRQEVGTLAVEIAERLIKRELREGDHRRLVEETLSRMESRS